MKRIVRTFAVALTALAFAVGPSAALTKTGAEIDQAATQALKHLYAKNPTAKALGGKAKGILVFPNIVKAGFMFGGQIGDGALRKGGRTVGYYNTVAGSYGLQAGVQTFGYALFFMNDKALDYLDKSEGFEVGVGPSVVIVDEGMGRSMTTTTLKEDVYAFIFDQKGMMAGMGIQGSKITKIDK